MENLKERIILNCRKIQIIRHGSKAMAPCHFREEITAGAVVHGGTIMAILSSFYGGDYFDHQVKNGGGYRCLLSGTREQPKLQGVENIMGESERVIP